MGEVINMTKENETSNAKINKIFEAINKEKLTITDLLFLEKILQIKIDKTVKQMIKEE